MSEATALTAGHDRANLVVIGGGIVGLASAWAVAQRWPDRRIIVLEAESEVAAHQTGHNSGVIHSGLYYKPGSLKARNCTEGRELLYEFCTEHGIPHERCGKLVVATEQKELPALDRLIERGRANGLDGLDKLGPEQLREYEPHVAGLAGIRVNETGIVDYPAVTRKLAELVTAAGGMVRTGCRVKKVRRVGDEIVLASTRGEVVASRLIACAGLQSDRVAQMCGLDPGVRIVPFRGEYYQLVPERTDLVRDLIYPVPDPDLPFLGVHFTRMIHGGVEAGPNAVLALRREGYRKTSFSPRDLWSMARFGGFWRMSAGFWRTGVREQLRSWSKGLFVRDLRRLIPELQRSDVKPAGAGVRAQAVWPNGKLLDDFHIVSGPGMVHVLNAPSPAATACLSIGRAIAERASDTFEWGTGRKA